MSESLILTHFLFFGEQCERLANDRSFTLTDVSESLIFGQKTSNSLGNQMRKFPALHILAHTCRCRVHSV